MSWGWEVLQPFSILFQPSGRGVRLPEVFCIISCLGCFGLFSKVGTWWLHPAPWWPWQPSGRPPGFDGSFLPPPDPGRGGEEAPDLHGGDLPLHAGPPGIALPGSREDGHHQKLHPRVGHRGWWGSGGSAPSGLLQLSAGASSVSAAPMGAPWSSGSGLGGFMPWEMWVSPPSSPRRRAASGEDEEEEEE